MSRLDTLFKEHLDQSADEGLRRRLRPLSRADAGRVRLGGRDLVNFSSNDYLGLSQHPALIERSADWAAAWGVGAGASRLVTGTLELHTAIEAKIARFKGTDAALIFNSGWQANATILPALLQRTLLGAPALIFSDKLIHASLHHGCAAAAIRQIRYRHNDLNHLETLLKAEASSPGQRFIITESVFSMDGDRADIGALCDLADRFDAFVYLDEAHATGVLGPGGAGLSKLAEGRVDLTMGTFSKGFGSFGAYVAGSKALCDYLVNHASGFIYATALPPAVLGAIDAALDLMPTLDAEREALQLKASRLRQGFRGLGLETAGSSTQIVPAVVGTPQRASDLSAKLEEAGILASAIRPPTVPAGTSRLRFALTALHSDRDVDHVVGAMAAVLA